VPSHAGPRHRSDFLARTSVGFVLPKSLRRHRPPKRAIQYSVGFVVNRSCLGRLDAPLSRSMTAEGWRASLPSVTRSLSPEQPYGEPKSHSAAPCISNESTTNLQAAGRGLTRRYFSRAERSYNHCDSAPAARGRSAISAVKVCRSARPNKSPAASRPRAQLAVSHFANLGDFPKGARIIVLFIRSKSSAVFCRPAH